MQVEQLTRCANSGAVISKDSSELANRKKLQEGLQEKKRLEATLTIMQRRITRLELQVKQLLSLSLSQGRRN